MLVRAVALGASALFAKETPEAVRWAFDARHAAPDDARRLVRRNRGKRLARTMRRLRLREDEARLLYETSAPAIFHGHYDLPA